MVRNRNNNKKQGDEDIVSRLGVSGTQGFLTRTVDVVASKVVNSLEDKKRSNGIQKVTFEIKRHISDNMIGSLATLEDLIENSGNTDRIIGQVRTINGQIGTILGNITGLNNKYERVEPNVFQGNRAKGFAIEVSKLKQLLSAALAADSNFYDAVLNAQCIEKKRINEADDGGNIGCPYLLVLLKSPELLDLLREQGTPFATEMRQETSKMEQKVEDMIGSGRQIVLPAEIKTPDPQPKQKPSKPTGEPTKSAPTVPQPARSKRKPKRAKKVETIEEKRKRLIAEWKVALKSGLITSAFVSDMKTLGKWLLFSAAILIPNTGFFTGALLIVIPVLLAVLACGLTLHTIFSGWKFWKYIPVQIRQGITLWIMNLLRIDSLILKLFFRRK